MSKILVSAELKTSDFTGGLKRMEDSSAASAAKLEKSIGEGAAAPFGQRFTDALKSSGSKLKGWFTQFSLGVKNMRRDAREVTEELSKNVLGRDVTKMMGGGMMKGAGVLAAVAAASYALSQGWKRAEELAKKYETTQDKNLKGFAQLAAFAEGRGKSAMSAFWGAISGVDLMSRVAQWTGIGEEELKKKQKRDANSIGYAGYVEATNAGDEDGRKLSRLKAEIAKDKQDFLDQQARSGLKWNEDPAAVEIFNKISGKIREVDEITKSRAKLLDSIHEKEVEAQSDAKKLASLNNDIFQIQSKMEKISDKESGVYLDLKLQKLDKEAKIRETTAKLQKEVADQEKKAAEEAEKRAEFAKTKSENLKRDQAKIDDLMSKPLAVAAGMLGAGLSLGGERTYFQQPQSEQIRLAREHKALLEKINVNTTPIKDLEKVDWALRA